MHQMHVLTIRKATFHKAKTSADDTQTVYADKRRPTKEEETGTLGKLSLLRNVT